MKATIIIPSVIAFVCICGALLAQDGATSAQPAPEAAAAVQPQAAGTPEANPAPAAPAAQAPAAAKPAAAPAVPAAAPAPAGTDALTLQDMSDGDFRYTRIQGMTFEKKKILAAGETAVPEAQAAKSSSSGSGWVVKIALLSIVILVFLLYRYGRRGGRRKVLRRFPK